MTKHSDTKKDPLREARLLAERIECVPDWVWEVDLDGVIQYSNGAVKAILGYAARGVIGRRIFDLLSEDDAAKCHQVFEEAASIGKSIGEIIAHFRCKDSSIRTTEVRCVPVLDDAGALVGYRGITRDITSQVARMEAALEAEANYKVVAENSQTGLFIVQNSIVVYANPRICELMGYTREELVGNLVWPYVYPDDAVRLGDYERRRIAGEDVPSHYVARGVTKGGEVISFDFRASVVRHKGAPAVLLNAIDITDTVRAQEALAESERDFRDLVEKISDWVWQVDEDSVYTYASPRARDLIGYEPEEILGKTPFDFMTSEEAARVSSIFGLVAAKREPLALMENTLVHRDGHPVVVETSGEPVFDDQGVYRGYRGIDRDITARKMAEEQVERTTSEMETVLHAFPDLYFWLDAEGRFINYHAVELSELYVPPDEFLGRRFEEVLPEDVGRDLARAFEVVQRTGVAQAVDYPLDVRGQTLYYEARFLPLPDNQIIVMVRNITERRKALEALRESRGMLRIVMENIPQFVFWKDTNSVYLGCNDNFARAAGLGSPADIVGKTDLDMPWGATEADAYREWDRKVMEADQPQYSIIETQHTAEGKTVTVSTNKVPLHDAEGSVVGILGTYEDITERRLAEQALQEAEAKYRSLVEETMVGVYMIQDDRFVYVNPRMLEVFGATEDEMLGKSPLEFVLPEDRATVAENIRRRVRQEIRSVRYAFRAFRMDGTPIDVEVHGAVTSFAGRPAIIGSLIDITERKRYLEALQDNEERYRQLFEHSPDMVFLMSAKTMAFIAMNPAVTQVLGYAAYDVLGRWPWDISPEFQPDGESSKEKAERLIQGIAGGDTQRMEWVVRHKDGQLIDCELSLVAYKFHGEDLVQAIVRDVSERKRAEENRRKFERDIEVQKRSFYRETILSVTSGKLSICDCSDVEPFVVRAVSAVEVNDASEVSDARRAVEAFSRDHGLTGERLDFYMLAVGEAITNAIKHGVNGRVYMGENESSVWVAIADQGTGIESLILPRAVLLRGFSTKPSLGLGYSIMLDVCDSILLSTGEQGTTVVLIKDKLELDLAISPEFLPDTWDNVPG